MTDFIYVGSWFDKKYAALSDKRFQTFKTALSIYHQTQGKIIVETGTTRFPNDWGAGSSTILFGDYLKHYEGKLTTVDIVAENIATCKLLTKEFEENIEYVVKDSLEYLISYNSSRSIDLLYLDSADYPLDGSNPKDCQEHQLNELALAIPQMRQKQKIILLDDNDFPNGGKTRLSKEFLEKQGGLCLIDTQQSLWLL